MIEKYFQIIVGVTAEPPDKTWWMSVSEMIDGVVRMGGRDE